MGPMDQTDLMGPMDLTDLADRMDLRDLRDLEHRYFRLHRLGL
jgi:hypothetical protein